MSIRPTHEQGQETHDRDCKRIVVRARLGYVWFLSILALLLLAACSNPPVDTWGDDEIVLLVLDSPGSSSPFGLASRTVSGRVSIAVETSLTVTEIQFFVDDEGFSENPVVSDTEAPFEFELDTTDLYNGDHTVSVLAHVDEDGVESTRFRHARFTVRNSADTTRTSPKGSDPGSLGEFSLRGDPSFDESLLSADARLWYRRLWAAIENPDQAPNGNGQVWSGSLRQYGYTFQQYMMYLFTGLRATGDLGFVDEIARLSDIMASKLTTEWYDPSTGAWYAPTDGTAGFRRWVYLRSNSTHNRVGKDTDTISAYKTHAVVSIMAYMFELNRDLTSPTGVDYGARADFWLDYLLNDFEAIWSKRLGTSRPGEIFDYSSNVGMSTLHAGLTYNYYMHKITGEDSRKAFADKDASDIAESMYTVDTPIGMAVVFGRPRDHSDGLNPIAYARYTWSWQVDIALDGHAVFGDAEYMAMHARTLSHFVMDNGTVDLSFDVGGMEDQTGISWVDGVTEVTMPTQNPYTSSSLEWKRESWSRFMISYMAPLAAFDDSGRVVDLSTQVFEADESDVENPKKLAVPAGMLLAAMMR